MTEFTQPFWNMPLTEADKRLDPDVPCEVGEIPDPDKFRAAGYTISPTGGSTQPPPDRPVVPVDETKAQPYRDSVGGTLIVHVDLTDEDREYLTRERHDETP